MFLLALGINKGTTAYYDIKPYYNFKIYPISNGIRQLSHTGSIYMIVALTLERYFTYCHPEKAKWLCSRPIAKFIVILVSIMTLLFTIPVFLEHEWDSDGNVQETSIRNNSFYEKSNRTWMLSAVRFFIPTFCLVFFNFRIIREVNKYIQFIVTY